MKKFLEKLLKDNPNMSFRVMVFFYNGDSSMGELADFDEIGVVLKSSKEEFSKSNPPILIPFTSILKIEVKGGTPKQMV